MQEAFPADTFLADHGYVSYVGAPMFDSAGRPVGLIELARASPPEPALIDIAMPGIDGYATARQLRANDPEKHILLVALTGFGQAADVSRARDACFDHHLTKPASAESLHDIIARLGRGDRRCVTAGRG